MGKVDSQRSPRKVRVSRQLPKVPQKKRQPPAIRPAAGRKGSPRLPVAKKSPTRSSELISHMMRKRMHHIVKKNANNSLQQLNPGASSAERNVSQMTEALIRDMEIEKKNLRDQQKAIKAAKNRKRRLEAEWGALNVKFSHSHAEHQIRSLEKYVNSAVEQRNKMLNTNVALRERIDERRQEVCHIKRRIDQLTGSTRSNQSLLDRKIAEARHIQAVEVVGLQSDVAALKQREFIETREFNAAMQQIHSQTSRDAEARVKSNKPRVRRGDALKQAATRRLVATQGRNAAKFQEEEPAGSMTLVQQRGLKEKTNKARWDIAKNVTIRMARQREEMKEEEAFARVREEAGITTVDGFVDEFLIFFQREFSTVKMVGALERELVELTTARKTLRHALDKLRARDGQLHGDRQTLLNRLNAQLAVYKRSSDRSHAEYVKDRQLLASLSRATLATVTAMGGAEPLLTTVLQQEGLTMSNTHKYMGTLEQGVGTLLLLMEQAGVDIPPPPPTAPTPSSGRVTPASTSATPASGAQSSLPFATPFSPIHAAAPAPPAGRRASHMMPQHFPDSREHGSFAATDGDDRIVSMDTLLATGEVEKQLYEWQAKNRRNLLEAVGSITAPRRHPRHPAILEDGSGGGGGPRPAPPASGAGSSSGNGSGRTRRSPAPNSSHRTLVHPASSSSRTAANVNSGSGSSGSSKRRGSSGRSIRSPAPPPAAETAAAD